LISRCASGPAGEQLLHGVVDRASSASGACTTCCTRPRASASAGADALGGQGQPPCLPLAHGVGQVGADHRGQDAESRFADGEAGVVGRDGDVAGAGQAHATAQSQSSPAVDGDVAQGQHHALFHAFRPQT
jgi:hypothetical protein